MIRNVEMYTNSSTHIHTYANSFLIHAVDVGRSLQFNINTKYACIDILFETGCIESQINILFTLNKVLR